MKLIHDVKYFNKKEILKRAELYEFPNPLAVEIFLWDCELASNFQEICNEIILKGGAAVQLHLPLRMQRGSVDIDLLAPLDEANIADIIKKLDDSLGETMRFKLHKPRKPTINIPMITYFANIPTVLNLGKRESLEIKIDILLEKLDLPTVQFENVQTFAVDVKSMKCFTPGVTIGDKILTLAKGSVGMELESDYPKQIYDLDALVSSSTFSDKTISDILKSIKKFTELEAGYRTIETSPVEALCDIITTMNEYSIIDTSGGNDTIKKDIESFQQFFVSKNQRSPLYGWSSKSLKIKFLANLVKAHIENDISETAVANAINKSKEIALKLNEISGESVKKIRKQLLDLAEVRIPFFKELRGKSLNRVFWQILSPNNLNDVESII
jgi:hypothetical protein